MGASGHPTKYRLPSEEPRGREVPGTLDPRDVLRIPTSHLSSFLGGLESCPRGVLLPEGQGDSMPSLLPFCLACRN